MAELDEGRPWEQGGGGAVGETSRAHEVFQVYLELGPKRSIVKAYNKHYRIARGLPPGNRATGTIDQWAARNNWKARAEAWDRAASSAALKTFEAERLEARQRLHAQLADVLDAALAVALGWDVPSWRAALEAGDEEKAAAARASRYKPRSTQQARMLIALLDRAGLVVTQKTELRVDASAGTNAAALGALGLLLKGIDDGSIDVAAVDAREASRLYREAIKGGQEDQ